MVGQSSESNITVEIESTVSPRSHSRALSLLGMWRPLFAMSKPSEEHLSEAETARRRDEVIRRMANTPPQPKTKPKKGAKPKKAEKGEPIEKEE